MDTATGLQAIAKSLRSKNQPLPEYFRLIAKEFTPGARQTAVFAVGCYWEGDRDLGRLDGVLATRTGTAGGEELVEAEYDPRQVDYSHLAGMMKRMACFRRAYPPGAAVAIAPAEQQHFHLSMHPEYQYLPLTSGQAMHVNAALFAHEDPDRFLSPAQLAMKRRLGRVLARQRDGAALFDDLTPDRSPEGLARDLRQIERRLAGLD